MIKQKIKLIKIKMKNNIAFSNNIKIFNIYLKLLELSIAIIINLINIFGITNNDWNNKYLIIDNFIKF